MGDIVKNEGVVAIMEEVTEGTYVPEAASEDFIETLADGLEFVPGRELLERAIRTGTTEKVASRVGSKTSTGSIPVELKAGSNEGDAPETDKLYSSAFGGKRQVTTAVTTGTGHSTTVINIEDADIADFNVGDTVLIKEAGTYHTSPVTAVDTSVGAANITILVAGASAFSDNVEIAKSTTYYVDSASSKTLSVTNYDGGKIREKIIGLRPAGLEFSNITTGQLPQASFSLEGFGLDKEVGTPLYTAAYDSSLPPVILQACIYMNGVAIELNEFTLSLANTLAFKTTTCSENGRIASRITLTEVTGSINPYSEDDSVDRFDNYNENTKFSLFMRAYNPTAVSGEYGEVFSIYLPNCRITEFASADQEGLGTDAISFGAYKTDGNDTAFLTFI